MITLEALFKQVTGAAPVSVKALTGSASHRRYYRLTGPDGLTLIGVEGTDPDENRAFVTLARHFAEKGIRVPKVLAESGLCYLQEDLGSHALSDAIAGGRFSGRYGAEEVALLRKTLSALPKIQVEGARGLDWSVCYPQPSFDARMVDFDLNYFKYDFLKLCGPEFNEVRLQDDFDHFREDLLAEPSDTFLYRDFNARNVMLVDGEPYFIDFQGGRKGPVYYDVASFVWQARARFPDALREELLQAYLDALREYMPVDETHFRERLRLFILFRMLQVLGCYGYRGLWEGNPAFVEGIAPALEIVHNLLPFNDYPYLSEVLGGLTSKGLVPRPSEDASKLTVTVYSFSYKKGIPKDASGNGGGYVFDCRSIHNPGKYDRFKQLTGLDEPVIRFLEEDGEILRFLEHVYALVDAHVERFLERGFTHLQVSFGCTGGQHRSAYSAQHLAEHLSAKYPVRVHLIHRELGKECFLSC